MKTKEHQLDLRWLEAYRSQDPHFGLERMEALLALRRKSSLRLSSHSCCGDQWQRLYHCYLVPTLEAGRFTGWSLYLPYLIHYNDQSPLMAKPFRIKTCKPTWIGYQQLLQAEQSKAVFQGLTEFEVMTAIAYDYFAHEELDYVIMEVGMGDD